MSRLVTFPGEVSSVRVHVTDDPGQGGMCHKYRIEDNSGVPLSLISFQDGPILENGVNGVTNESLLLVVLDRLRSAQAGPFSCRENAIVATKIEEALLWLNHRTAERKERGVEGRNVK